MWSPSRARGWEIVSFCEPRGWGIDNQERKKLQIPGGYAPGGVGNRLNWTMHYSHTFSCKIQILSIESQSSLWFWHQKSTVRCRTDHWKLTEGVVRKLLLKLHVVNKTLGLLLKWCVIYWQFVTRKGNKNHGTERESWGVGRDMGISLRLLLEVVIKRKSNSWDLSTFKSTVCNITKSMYDCLKENNAQCSSD